MDIKSTTSNYFQKGFSLVEILLVVVIAALIVLLIGNIPSSLNLVGNSKKESLAKEIALKKVEDLRDAGYDNLANGTSNIVDIRLSSLPSSQGTITITDCPAEICTNSEEIKQLSINISWIDSGNNKKVELVTLLAKNGLK